MLYPARMKKVTLLVHSDFIFPLTRELHRSGLMQIDPIVVNELEKRSPDRTRIEDISSRLESIMETIRSEEDIPVKELILHPGPPEVFEIPIRSEEDIIERAEAILPGIEEEIRLREDRLLRLRERTTRLQDQRTELTPLKGLDFDISLLGEGDYATIIAGSTQDLEGLLTLLDSDLVHVYHEGTKGEYSVIIIAHESQVRNVEKARRQRYFDGIDLDFVLENSDFTGRPMDILREIDTELLSIRAEIDDVETELTDLYKKKREDLLILQDEISILLENYKVFDRFGVTRTTTTLSGWIEKGMEEDFETLCSGVTEGHITIMFDDPEGEEAPSKLRNSSWAQPFEPLVHMFSTPKYNELDTSMVVGPLFIIFFGLMVGDAGYGLILIAMGLFVMLKHGRFSAEIRDYGYFILLMGIATCVFGIIMGGLFYDSIQRFVYGDETMLLYPKISLLGLSFPMDPMNEPTTIFLASLIIGLLTLNIGVVLSTYDNIRKKNYFDLVTNNLSWFILQPGGILLIGGMMFGAFQLSTTITAISSLTFLLGVVLRVIYSKGLVMFDFTGFVGNVLSFARILALALATAGLALAINFFSQIMGEIHPVLIIGGLLLFIIAHIMNTLLQSLGAGIHSLRLQYVEFFSMFYEGGGKEFEPFQIERSYTKVVDQ